jgi:hypothetical protein
LRLESILQLQMTWGLRDMQAFSVSDWLTLSAFLVNLGAIAKAYAHFEHRFTKLETQMDMLVRYHRPHEGG